MIEIGATWVIRGEPATGKLKAVWRAPGIGDRSYIHRGMRLTFADVDARGICGNRVCIAPISSLAVFTCERRLISVDLHSCRERVLLDDCGEEWIFGAPCVSPDENYVAITLSSAHPEIRAGRPVTRPFTSFRDHRLRLIRLPLDGSGRPEIPYEHEPAQSAHCAYNPGNGNILYFDLDLPPGYWRGGDGKTPRIWLCDIATQSVGPLKDLFLGPFQTHQTWLWDGSAMAYHGTEWGSLPGQYSHPHPLTDPGGRWISFTSARQSRSDVFVVDVSSK